MQNATMYCLSLYDKTLPIIKKMGYSPVGLGAEKFSDFMHKHAFDFSFCRGDGKFLRRFLISSDMSQDVKYLHGRQA